MKKLLLAYSLLISVACNASNLEFNQVILIDGTTAFSQTVPVGKVWEIKSASHASNGTYPAAPISINGKSITLIPQVSSSYTSSNTFNLLPFWIPAGTVVSGGPNYGLYSIIEYNIVP